MYKTSLLVHRYWRVSHHHRSQPLSDGASIIALVYEGVTATRARWSPGVDMAQLIALRARVRRRTWTAPGRLSAATPCISRVCVTRDRGKKNLTEWTWSVECIRLEERKNANQSKYNHRGERRADYSRQVEEGLKKPIARSLILISDVRGE